jgi:hypothetical protein
MARTDIRAMRLGTHLATLMFLFFDYIPLRTRLNAESLQSRATLGQYATRRVRINHPLDSGSSGGTIHTTYSLNATVLHRDTRGKTINQTETLLWLMNDHLRVLYRYRDDLRKGQ